MSRSQRKSTLKVESTRLRPALTFRVLETRKGRLVHSTKARRNTTASRASRKLEIPVEDNVDTYGEHHADLGGSAAAHDPNLGYFNEDLNYSDEEEWMFEPVAPPEIRNSTSTSTNTYSKRWRDTFTSLYLSKLYRFDGAPPNRVCASCQRPDPPCLYRCNSCFGAPDLCRRCMRSSHKYSMTHSIRAWNGQFWVDSSLAALGLVTHLGHEGAECPHKSSIVEIWVGDLNGFRTIPVTFCQCASVKELPRGLQLIDIGVFPCSDAQPQSGFTITLLRYFTVFATLSKGSGHKFYSILERLTCPGFPSTLPNRARELLATHRRYTYLLLLRRSGQSFPTPLKLTGDNDFTIQCPACPNPGVNFIQSEVNEDELPYMRLWLSYDGNFRNPRKAKKVDKDDFSFTGGNMYYVDQEEYKSWLQKVGKEYGKRETRPECDNHKAAQDKFVKWGGLDVTGVGAFTCARHSFFIPRGLVDFYQGELFAYADYAFASVLKWLTRNGSLQIGMTYDIWCHWIPKLGERARQLPPDLMLPEDIELIGGIPKFHLQGHKKVCWIRFSLNNMTFVGRIEGEGAERAWAYLNETSGSTSEKSPGARWDSINLIVLDWNFEKDIRMPAFLVAKFIDAKKMYAQQEGVFNQLHKALPPNLTSQWADTSTEPVEQARGKWTSPFEVAERDAPGVQETIQLERLKEEAASSELNSAKSGATKWMATAIELEYSMELLRREAAQLGKDATPGQHNVINDKRKSINNRVLSHRTKHASYMGDVGSPDHPKRRVIDSCHPEHAELGLPTSYDSTTLKKHLLLELLDVELQLRRATCNDALESIKNLLGAKALLLRYKRQYTKGERAVTRAEKVMKEQQEKVSRAQWKYNNSREALLRLSTEESDSENYLFMKEGDLRRLDDYLEESQGLGQGYEGIPWIWRSLNAPNAEGWQSEALKSEWFRARQRYRQWEDELKLIKREMVMTIRSYEHRASVWHSHEQCNALTAGMAEYAARKSDFYSRLAKNAVSLSIDCIEDPVVSFEWVSQWAAMYKARAL